MINNTRLEFILGLDSVDNKNIINSFIINQNKYNSENGGETQNLVKSISLEEKLFFGRQTLRLQLTGGSIRTDKHQPSPNNKLRNILYFTYDKFYTPICFSIFDIDFIC